MEEHYGVDFSAVRLHSGSDAHLATREVDARAFTSGSHVVLGSHVDPYSSRGRTVLAHELAHVVQQSRGERPSGWIDGGPNDALERAADQMTRAEAMGATPVPSVGAVQRTAGDAESLSQTAPRHAATAETREAEELDTILRTIAQAAVVTPGLQELAGAIQMVRGAIYVWNHREELMQRLITAIGEYVTRVPALMMTKLSEYAASLGGDVAAAAACIGGEMWSLLGSLAANWREVATNLLRDVVLVYPVLQRGIPIIVDNLHALVTDIGNSEYRSAIDRAVAIMTEVNSIAGVFFIWFAVIATLLGTGAGTVEPGAGNAAGAAAGMTFAQVFNIALIASVAAAEGTRIVRGLQDMQAFREQPALRQAACHRVAEGIFSLSIMDIMFFFGPSVIQFARQIIARAAAFIRVLAADLERALVLQPGALGPLQFAGPGTGYAPPPPVGMPPGFELPPVAEPPVGGRRAPTPRPPVVTEPVTPQLQPATGPQTRPLIGTGAAGALSEDALRRTDACYVALGLRPRLPHARWIHQRDPIMNNRDPIGPHTTVRDAAFRLDAGIAPPAGQDTNQRVRDWVRGIGRSYDDAGHVIANRFGGRIDHNSPDGNIFPQEYWFNQQTMNHLDGTAERRHREGCDVCVYVALEYESPTSLRPVRTWWSMMYRSVGATLFNPVIGPTQVPNR
jgi:hypothetical protein